MPIVQVQRITSQTNNVVGVNGDRAAAIAALLAGTPPNVIATSNPLSTWPALKKYTNDTNEVPDPQTIWTPNPQPGDIRAFAVSSNPIPVTAGVGQEFMINLAVFSDNAHNAQIDAVSLASLSIIPTTNLGVTLNDGSLATSTGLTEVTPPYNWQFVRYYSIPVTLGLVFVGLGVRFIFSFEAVNYQNAPNQTINPAGLAFVADIYQVV